MDRQPEPRPPSASSPTRADDALLCEGIRVERPQIHDHELLRPIGTGSYGEVWLARNVMGTYRAVKIVRRSSFRDPRPFEREFAGISKYERVSRTHDDLIDVLQVGRNDEHGYFYSVMELGDDVTRGQDIDPETYQPRTLAREFSDRGPLPFAECLQLGLALVEGVSHLHKHGLIHRDLKPSNVVFVNGIPKIADIGLVTEAGAQHSLVGTPGFMPPEGPGTIQADIYSLGKILYEISSGKDRQSFPEAPQRSVSNEESNNFLELNEVILQACEDDFTKRYKTVEELRSDLLLLQAGKSVRRLHLLERRTAILIRAGLVAAVCAVLAGAAYLQVSRERRLEREGRAASYVAYGARLMDEGDLYGALPSFAAALALEQDTPDLASRHRVHLGVCLRQCPKLTQMWFLPVPATSVGFNSSGNRVVVAGASGRAWVFDPGASRPLFELKGHAQDTAVEHASFSPDGRMIVTASEDGTARIWDAEKGEELAGMSPLRHAERTWDKTSSTAAASAEPLTAKRTGVCCACFNPRGDMMVTGCGDGGVRVWELGNRERPRLCFRAHSKAILYASFSPDGNYIVTCSQDHTARLWNANTGKPLLERPFSHADWVYKASFSPDGHRVVTVSYDKLACLWSVETGALLATFQPQAQMCSASFSPDGRYIAVACLDYGSTTRIWEAAAAGETRFLLRHTSYPVGVAYAPDGHRLAVAEADGVIRLWDLAGNALDTASEPVAYSAEGLKQASVRDGRLEIQRSIAGRVSIKQVTTEAPVVGVVLNPNGERLLAASKVSGGSGNCLAARIWDTTTGGSLGPPFALPWAEAHVALSPDGTRLLAAQGTNASVWDTTLGKPLYELAHSNKLEGLSFSPVGHRFATWAGTHAFLWNSENGTSIRQLAHFSKVGHVEFSPDGRHLISCSGFSQLCPSFAQLYDAESGTPLGIKFRHNDGVDYAAFSPDGQRVVTASEDRSARIWDCRTGRQLTPPLIHRDQVLKACFSPDSRRVGTLCRDRSIRIWDAASGMPLTPNLRLATAMEDLQFIEGGKRILCTRRAQNYLSLEPMFYNQLTCDLSPDERPTAQLALMARVLSGRQGAELSGGLPLEREALQEGWRQLREKDAADFVVSGNEVWAWHQSEARISEEAANWYAARFHLSWLARLQPGDQDVAGRLAQAQTKLSAKRGSTQ